MIASKAEAADIRGLDVPGMEIVLHFNEAPPHPVMLSLELARALQASLNDVISKIDADQSPSSGE